MQNSPSATIRSHQLQDLATLATILTGVIVVSVLYLAREVLIPIALAVLISFVLAPLALVLRRTGLPRVPSVIAVVAVSFGVILGVGALGTTQLSQLAEKLPQYQSNISDKIRSLRGTTAGGVSVLVFMLSGSVYDSVGAIVDKPIVTAVPLPPAMPPGL